MILNSGAFLFYPDLSPKYFTFLTFFPLGPSRLLQRPFLVPHCAPHVRADAVTFWHIIEHLVECRLVNKSLLYLNGESQMNSMKFALNSVSRKMPNFGTLGSVEKGCSCARPSEEA